MNYYPFRILLPSLVCFLSLGCDRAEHSAVQPRDQQATATKSATEPSENPSVVPYQFQPKPGQVPIEDAVVKANFEKIRQLREAKKEIKQANAEFKRLCEMWNPVGRPVSEVKEVVGKPDWEKEDSFGYEFDTGWNGWLWTFFSSKGEVSRIQFDPLD